MIAAAQAPVEHDVSTNSSTERRAHRSEVVYIRRLGERNQDHSHGVSVHFTLAGNPSICCVCGENLFPDTYPGPRAVVTFGHRHHGEVCVPCLLSPEGALRKRAMLNLKNWRNAVKASVKEGPLWIETLAIDAGALAVIASALSYGLFIEARGLKRFLAFHGYEPADLRCYDVPELRALDLKGAQ